MKLPPPSRLCRTAYQLQERLPKRPTFAHLDELERSQWLPREEIEALQARKLVCLLAIANAHCTWHAARRVQAGLGDVNEHSEVTLADLLRIPTMDKTDAQLNGAGMRWEGVPGGAFPYNTGGSSGQPPRFLFGRWRLASDAAGRIRCRRWWGAEVGQPEVYLWGAPVELNKTNRVKTVRDRLLNGLVLNAFAMSPANVDTYLGAMARVDPVCQYGYASSIALLADHARGSGRIPHLKRFKVVCTTGEPLFPHQHELIAEVFGAPVANEFDSCDIGFTAHGSLAGEMLLLSESIVLEVLNPAGEPVAPGQSGEAVMTRLCSNAHSFIRYRAVDLLTLAAEPCGEARGLHVVEQVRGRSTDFVLKRDGTLMHSLSVICILRAAEGVGEFKIIQHEVDWIEVQLVANVSRRDGAKERGDRTGIQAA